MLGFVCVATRAADANDLSFAFTVRNSDYVTAGVGGLRNVGNGQIALNGVNGMVEKAQLYWHGEANTAAASANVVVNGTSIQGLGIGLADDNCWNFSVSEAFQADVTELVKATGNGIYVLSGFSVVNPNGASLVVFFDDGVPANNHDVMLFVGNDSNIRSVYDAGGWRAVLSNVEYPGGSSRAALQVHVADGQRSPSRDEPFWDDADLIFNGAVLARGPEVFNGNSVPSANNGPTGNGSLWDILAFDVSQLLPQGRSSPVLTTGVVGDCLSLVVALVELPPTAPLELLPSTTRWKPQRDTSKNMEINFRGPKGLKPTTTLEITGPDGLAVANPSLSFTPPADPNADPAEYKITWSGVLDPATHTGSWVIKESSGNATYLKRGDYKIKVKGVKEDDTPIDSDPNAACLGAPQGSPPCSTVSLVEVTKVELCEPDDGDDCIALSDANPAVGTLPDQDPPQERPAEGKRIFAEATTPGGPLNNRIKLRAIIDPVIPADPSRPSEALTVPVNFKPFDVDDPAPYAPDLDGDTGTTVADNRGSPREGAIEQPIVNLAAGQTNAKSFFQTSLRPGDNYRAAASTSQEWLQGVRAVQPNQTGELGVTEEEKASVSDMLTVWRTLHVEMDSMGDPPADTPSDPNYGERNFIRGTITAIGEVRHIQGLGRKPTRLNLTAETTAPPLGLSDRSKDLSGTDDAFGFGRFEDGTIRIGIDAGVIAIDRLNGNGPDFVQKLGGITIPFRLVDASGGNALTGNILEWDFQAKEMTLSSAVGRPIYDGGALTVGGVRWTVQSARGPRVTVVEDQALPFYLVDDDDAVAPFSASTSLLQVSDDPTANLYAQAYIRPKYDVASPQQAPFNRNVNCPPTGTRCDTREARDQLASGRDSSLSTLGFWVMYAQGAFQADETGDLDPRSEALDSAAGETLGDSDRYGSLIYLETIRDSVQRGNAGTDACTAGTLVYELGHQFGLDDGTGGIMGPGGCLLAPRYFTDAHLARIRTKEGTQ